MHFEWNANKAATNLQKHGVSFREACSVFLDPLSATGADPDHSLEEHRFVTFGFSYRRRLLVVSHVDRGNAIRIISARPATRAEKVLYEEDLR